MCHPECTSYGHHAECPRVHPDAKTRGALQRIADHWPCKDHASLNGCAAWIQNVAEEGLK